MDTGGVTDVTRMPIPRQQPAFSLPCGTLGHDDLHAPQMQTPAGAPPSPPDFDFSMPCRYFKSSFARSLSLNNASSHCKSLDFDINQYRGAGNNNNYAECPPLPMRRTGIVARNEVNGNQGNGVDNNNHNGDEHNVAGSDGEVEQPPTIPARRPAPKAMQSPQQPKLVPLRSMAVAGSAHAKLSQAHFNGVTGRAQQQPHRQRPVQPQQQHQQQQQLPQRNGASVCNNGVRQNIWPSGDREQDCHLQNEDPIKYLSTPEHNAAATTPKPIPAAPSPDQHAPFEVQESSTINVEAVLLRNKVDTLQWQLKQVETSCEMYRAVMEEVLRFLDRYNNQKQQRQLQANRIGMEHISRSKSLYQVYAGGSADGGHEKNPSDDEAHTAYLRTRSSSNLIDLKLSTPLTDVSAAATTPTKAATMHGSKLTTAVGANDSIYDVMTPSPNSYTAFKDFTWRRSPKKLSASKASVALEELDEKLNQDAFRLSRTIHNLLNTSTRQPDLTQHRNSLAPFSFGRVCKMSAKSAPTAAAVADLSSPSSANASTSSGGSKSSPLAAAEILFLRSNNMRDSRISLRSSTDSSVHSTTSSAASSSSKVETDEEATLYHSPSLILNKQLHPPFGSTTEDESGFSSISSFQDIGVPFNSTMISHSSTDSSKRTLSCNAEPNSLRELNVDSRNSTLKALSSPSATHPNNVVGLPLQPTHDMQHRWDAPSKTFHTANKYQRFSTLSNDDATAVLWV